MSKSADRYRRKLLADLDTIAGVAREILADQRGIAMHQESRDVLEWVAELAEEVRGAPRKGLYRTAGQRIKSGYMFIRRAMDRGCYRPDFMTVIAGKRRAASAGVTAVEPEEPPPPLPASPPQPRTRPTPSPERSDGRRSDRTLGVQLSRLYRMRRRMGG